MPTAGQHQRRFPCRLFLIITLLLDSAFFGAKKGRERGRGQKGAEKEGQGTREPTVTVTQCCQHGARGMQHPGVLGGYGGHSPAQARADLGNFMSSGQPAAAAPLVPPVQLPMAGDPTRPDTTRDRRADGLLRGSQKPGFLQKGVFLLHPPLHQHCWSKGGVDVGPCLVRRRASLAG